MVVTSGNLLCYVVFIDKFIFFSPAIKTSYLKSEDFSRKPSEFLDSTDRNYYAKLWAKLSSKKSPVERESFQRQHETARQALMGKTPRGHTLLFQRGPVPIPTVSGLQYFTTLEELQKSLEFSEDNDKTPFGPYTEISKDPHSSMKYSQLFHACPWAKDVPYVQLPEGGVSSRPGSATSDEVDGPLKGTHCSM
ncbi:Leucine-rich repeat and guanylate kinase domain-containing protein [Microtus ochrogaster]|uniref:Leucine-rich repeat and guanylate kinase domain-containing protein n=1 Tax=Microtus ochrogaster TaxID=79684 RepID=A0A8J6GBK4_MICOH|nr:Leucine-rich repeat and guanylate kinase domain-containing protein [Microtus ochrogaster]